MARVGSRREFLRNLGIGAGGVAVCAESPSLGLANSCRGASGWSSCSAPTASCPKTFWPDEEGENFTLKESLHAAGAVQGPHAHAARRVRQDSRRRRQPHARHRLPAHRHRAVPRQHPRRLATRPPAGPSGISIDQEIKNFLQANPSTRTRFGSLEFGVMVPDRADTWTRMSYAGAEQAARADRRSVPDVRQALRPDEGPGKPAERARRAAGRSEEGRAAS